MGKGSFVKRQGRRHRKDTHASGVRQEGCLSLDARMMGKIIGPEQLEMKNYGS